MGLCDDVRRHCAEVAAAARWVAIDRELLDAVEPPPGRWSQAAPLDPRCHFLDGEPAQIASYLLVLDTINFGSGWFPTLAKRPGCGGYTTIAWALADRFRLEGAWSGPQLRRMAAAELGPVLGQPADHELIALYAEALRALGRFLGPRTPLELIDAAGSSAERLAETLAGGMAMFADRGFYKRAQITAADLALAGVADFADVDRLTIFADNLVPHVLRCDGVLRYDPGLAEHIDAGRLLAPGRAEEEIRACAVHACELLAQRFGVAARVLDGWLWNRGQAPAYKVGRPRHRCRCVYY
ncbi:MAG: hypothetical protein QOF77_1672 [Solirubrobacteraceae bacterium]|jgi:hypothetical protein|nr:hypothetical protein [Solirubrobacteraceae bacterium]